MICLQLFLYILCSVLRTVVSICGLCSGGVLLKVHFLSFFLQLWLYLIVQLRFFSLLLNYFSIWLGACDTRGYLNVADFVHRYTVITAVWHGQVFFNYSA